MKRFEILADDGVRSRRFDEAKESLDVIVRLHLVAPEREEIIQGDALTRPWAESPRRHRSTRRNSDALKREGIPQIWAVIGMNSS